MNKLKHALQTALFTAVGVFGVIGVTLAFQNLSTATGGGSGSSAGCTADCTFTGTTAMDLQTFTSATGTNEAITGLFTFGTATGTTERVNTATIGTLNAGTQTMTGLFTFVTATGTTLNSNTATIGALNGGTLIVTGNSTLASATGTNFASTGLFTFASATGTTILSNTATIGVGTVSTLTWANATGSNINLNSNGNITTNGASSIATLTLSGGSGAITATNPIPTSTTLIVGSFPQYTFSFDATNTDCMYWGPSYIRDAWDAKTMSPRITWQAVSGTGVILWSLQAESAVSGTYAGAPFTGAKAYATSTAYLGNGNSETSFSTLTVGSAAAKSPLKFALCREGSHGQDTFGGTSYPMTLDVEYGINAYSDSP